jgi:hypothetical protein
VREVAPAFFVFVEVAVKPLRAGSSFTACGYGFDGYDLPTSHSGE